MSQKVKVRLDEWREMHILTISLFLTYNDETSPVVCYDYRKTPIDLKTKVKFKLDVHTCSKICFCTIHVSSLFHTYRDDTFYIALFMT